MKNTNPDCPWNDFEKDDPTAPWNDIMYRDDPTTPWNDPIADRNDYEDWKREHYRY